MEEVKSELVSIRKEDYDLLVAGCERLLEKENEKPVEINPDMFSGLNAMLRKDVVEEYELENEEFGMTSDEIKEHNENIEPMNLENINLSDTPDIP